MARDDKYCASNYSYHEMIKLVMGKNFWQSNDLDNKLETFYVSDGPVGVRSTLDANLCDKNEEIPSTAYPSGEVLASTFNVSLAKEYAKSIADDLIERKLDILLAPGINIKRNPLCGRNFEYFSEDPLLSGELAKYYIEGLNEKHVGSSLKHYICNNSEYQRNWVSSEVDERALQEIYLANFKRAFQGKPWTLMCSYNLLNGVRMSENKPLYDFAYAHGFDGLIISDWGAVKDATLSINAGLHLIMPYDKRLEDQLIKDLDNGRLNKEALKNAAQKVLDLIKKNEEEKKYRKIEKSLRERKEVALNVALEGIVLLQNKGNLLPLKDKNIKILVAGAPTVQYFNGGGSSRVAIEEPFKTLASSLREIGYKNIDEGEIATDNRAHAINMGNFKKFIEKAYENDILIMGVGGDKNLFSEDFDRQDMKLANEEILAIRRAALTHKKIVLLVYGGGAVELEEVSQLVDAIIYVGFSGERVSDALAKLFTGEKCFSGRLAETFALSLKDYPSSSTYVDESLISYSEGLDVGYRHFVTHDIKTLYPFGYGLSYSEFVYSNLKVIKDEKNHLIHVSFNVKNVGEYDAKEVVLLFVSPLTKNVYRPKRELKRFDKIFIKKGEEATVNFALDIDDFKYFNLNYHEFIFDHGRCRIEINKDAENVILNEEILL